MVQDAGRVRVEFLVALRNNPARPVLTFNNFAETGIYTPIVAKNKYVHIFVFSILSNGDH